jgi:hypothetical protein
MVDDGNFVMQDVAVGLVEVDSLLDDGLIILVQRDAGLIEGALAPEISGLDDERIEFSVAILVDPSADGITDSAGLDIRRQSRPSV